MEGGEEEAFNTEPRVPEVFSRPHLSNCTPECTAKAV